MATTTSLKLSEKLKERIAEAAHGVAQTPHAYMVEAIAEKVVRDEKRRSFHDAGRRALGNYRRSGIAYRAEDVNRYIIDIAAGKKPRRPKPIKVPRSER